MPKVSVVIPVYNMEAFLAETLDSVLASTYRDIEVVVIDDGSKDDSLAIARQYEQKDARVVVITQPNAGVCKARNRAISQARGEYILPVDSDNLLTDWFIERAITVLQNNPDVKVVAPDGEFFGARKGHWDLPPFSLRLLARRNIIDTCAMYRRSDWERIGGYCEEIVAREDWEFWIHMLKDGGRAVRLDGIGLKYRVRKVSKRITDRQMKWEVVKLLNAHHPEFMQRELAGPLHFHRSWSRLLNKITNFFYSHHLTVAPGYEDCSYFFRAMPIVFRTNRGEIIYDRRNQLRLLEYKGHHFVAKSFQIPNVVNRIVYGFIRPSKARRAYAYAALLQQKVIDTPTPVAYMQEQFLGMFFGKSYFISLQSTLKYTYNDIINGTLSAEDEEMYLRAIGCFTGRLHDAGMIHPDYSRGNLLFGLDEEGKPRVEVIDLNRIRFQKVSIQDGCANFAERLPATQQQRRIMAEAYANTRGLDAEKCLELMSKYNREKS